MRQFNTPPGWPDPPTARWRPPKHWRPAESWPAAPAGWAFWVDEHGKRVRGPIGRYGGPSRLRVAGIVTVPVVLVALVLLNPFRSSDSGAEPAAVPAISVTTSPTTSPAQATTEPTQPAGTPTGTPGSVDSTAPSTTPSPQLTPTTEPTTPTAGPTSSPPPSPTQTVAPTATTTTVVYQNCEEVRAAGKAPLHRGDPGYSRALDRNGDGIACDRGNS